MRPPMTNAEAIEMLDQRIPKFRKDVEKMKWILDLLTEKPRNVPRVHAFKLYWGLSGEPPRKRAAVGARQGITRQAAYVRCKLIEEQLRFSPLWDKNP